MKTPFAIAILALFTVACSPKTTFIIAANQSQVINYSSIDNYKLTITNASTSEIDIAIQNRIDSLQTGGFGLAKRSKESVVLTNKQQLTISNFSNERIKIVVATEEMPERKQITSSSAYINFKLINPSLTSIPLLIPGVMNPNLSPASSSGVSLKVGQKVLFNVNRKTHVLFVVDESYEGKEVNMAKLIKERKKELNL